MKFDRALPPPMRRKLHGREKVRVTKNLVYEDDFVLRSGSEGLALHPGSQAATWVVFFPGLKNTRRVVPEWDLEILERKGH